MEREEYKYEDFAGVNFQLAEMKAMFDTLESNTTRMLEPAVLMNETLAELKTIIQNLEMRIAGIESRETSREIKYAEVQTAVIALEVKK